MACCGTTTTTNSCNTCGNTCGRRGNGFLLVIVLYILLAIIVGSFVC